MGVHSDRVAALMRRRVEEQRLQLKARENAEKEAKLAQMSLMDKQGSDSTSVVGSASAGSGKSKNLDDLDAVTGLSALIEVLGLEPEAVGLDRRTGMWKQTP